MGASGECLGGLLRTLTFFSSLPPPPPQEWVPHLRFPSGKTPLWLSWAPVPIPLLREGKQACVEGGIREV